MLNENEMAAIAAGLWDGRSTELPVAMPHRCPNMREPANLWQAFKNVAEHYPFVWICFDGSVHIEACAPEIVHYGAVNIVSEKDSLEESAFAALVALYKAEHPNWENE